MGDRYISAADAQLICDLARKKAADVEAATNLPSAHTLQRAVQTAVRHIEAQQPAPQAGHPPDDAVTVRISMHDQYVLGWALSR